MLLIETCDYFHIFTGDLDVCVHRQCCIIKDWHPTVAMPFCEPQLRCTLRTSFTQIAGETGGKGKAMYISLTPNPRGCHTCSNVYSLFFYFPSSWALSTHWREAGTWDLKVMNSIALAVFIDVVSRWLWCLYSLYMGHRSLNITSINICFCLSTIMYGSQWNVLPGGK